MNRYLTSELVLTGANDAVIEDAGPEMAPARFLIHEWKEYAIVWAEDATRGGQIRVRGVPEENRREIGGSAFFSFHNQLGLANIEVLAGGNRCRFSVEVLSHKFPSADQHKRFYDRLVADLHEKSTALPFAVSSTTGARTRESIRPPSDLMLWHFFRHHGESIGTALATVLNRPRRQLTVEERTLPLDQITRVEAGAVIEALGAPGGLVPVAADMRAYEWPIARALQERRGSRRFVPGLLEEMFPEETLDTPEHRFVRSFVLELLSACRRLIALLPAATGATLRELAGQLDEAMHSSFLSEVGAMTVFPSYSHVLQRADGYRELLSCWRLFHTSLDPFSEMQRALDVRDVATLYEWWCFFAIVDELSRLKQREGEIVAGIDVLEGLLPERLWVRFEDGWELIFNKSFRRVSGSWRSYSVTLRPDFILARDGVPLVGLDAKFRFDRNDFQRAGDKDDEQADGEGPAIDPQLRLAKNSDIYKMHTYRDALKLRSVLVVYPGDESVLYRSDGQRLPGLTLADLIADPVPSGVGAITLSPEE